MVRRSLGSLLVACLALTLAGLPAQAEEFPYDFLAQWEGVDLSGPEPGAEPTVLGGWGYWLSSRFLETWRKRMLAEIEPFAERPELLGHKPQLGLRLRQLFDEWNRGRQTCSQAPLCSGWTLDGGPEAQPPLQFTLADRLQASGGVVRVRARSQGLGLLFPGRDGGALPATLFEVEVLEILAGAPGLRVGERRLLRPWVAPLEFAGLPFCASGIPQAEKAPIAVHEELVLLLQRPDRFAWGRPAKREPDLPEATAPVLAFDRLWPVRDGWVEPPAKDAESWAPLPLDDLRAAASEVAACAEEYGSADWWTQPAPPSSCARRAGDSEGDGAGELVGVPQLREVVTVRWVPRAPELRSPWESKEPASYLAWASEEAIDLAARRRDLPAGVSRDAERFGRWSDVLREKAATASRRQELGQLACDAATSPRPYSVRNDASSGQGLPRSVDELRKAELPVVRARVLGQRNGVYVTTTHGAPLVPGPIVEIEVLEVLRPGPRLAVGQRRLLEQLGEAQVGGTRLCPGTRPEPTLAVGDEVVVVARPLQPNLDTPFLPDFYVWPVRDGRIEGPEARETLGAVETVLELRAVLGTSLPLARPGAAGQASRENYKEGSP
jgi:hypothetical protein